MKVESSWNDWKQTLSQAVNLGQQMGLSQQDLTQRAETIGDFLSQNADTQVPEHQLLKELWQSGDNEEQQALASMIIKAVSQQ